MNILYKQNETFDAIYKISEIKKIHIERIVATDNKEMYQFVYLKYLDHYYLYEKMQEVEINSEICEILLNSSIINYYYDYLHDTINYKITDNKYIIKNFIHVIDDVIDKTFAQELILLINDKRNILRTEKWGEQQNVNCSFIDINKIVNADTRHYFDMKLMIIVRKIIEYNYLHYGILSQGDSGYCLRKIYGPTKLHWDGLLVHTPDSFSYKKIRNVSIIIALNDDYEDGEIHFPNQNIHMKIPKYSALCFPPYYTHQHYVTSPKNLGYRYTINTWLYE